MSSNPKDPHAWLAGREELARKRARHHRDSALGRVDGWWSGASSPGEGSLPSPASVVEKHPFASVAAAATGGFLLAPRRGSRSDRASRPITASAIAAASRVLSIARLARSASNLASLWASPSESPDAGMEEAAASAPPLD